MTVQCVSARALWFTRCTDTATAVADPKPARTRSASSTSSSAAKAALQRVGEAGLTGSQQAAARSAVKKIQLGLDAFGSSGSLESAMAKVLARQARQAEQGAELSKSTVLDRFDRLRVQNQKELGEIQKRLEAERSSGFWEGFIEVFKCLATAATAVSSIFTGPLGMAAAALMVASLIVSHTVSDDCGKWISLGLSLGGAACGVASALTNAASLASQAGAAAGAGTAQAGSAAGAGAAQAVSQTGLQAAQRLWPLIARYAPGAAQTTGGVCNGTAAIGTAVKGAYDQEALDAQAGLLEIKAIKRRLVEEAREATEEMKLVIEAQDRGVKIVVQSLQRDSTVSMAASAALSGR